MTTETQHTPAPWFVAHDKASDSPSHRNSGLALVETGRLGDFPIARLCEWNNVRLIAAAPDLLAALLYYRDKCSGAEPSLSVFHMLMDNAIDRATGSTGVSGGTESKT